MTVRDGEKERIRRGVPRVIGIVTGASDPILVEESARTVTVDLRGQKSIVDVFEVRFVGGR